MNGKQDEEGKSIKIVGSARLMLMSVVFSASSRVQEFFVRRRTTMR
jgi:hypothetical protein